DATDVGDLGPIPFAHVQLGAIEAERFDLDNDVAFFRFRLWDLPDDQHLRATESRSENRSHQNPSPQNISTKRASSLENPAASADQPIQSRKGRPQTGSSVPRPMSGESEWLRAMPCTAARRSLQPEPRP